MSNNLKEIDLLTDLVTVGVFSQFRIPSKFLTAIIGSNPTQVWVLFVIAGAFFIGCMFVDPIVVIMILTPIFKPVVIMLGIDPVLVGTMVTLQSLTGSATPPFGCDIFTAIAIFKRSYFQVIKKTPVFIAMLLVFSALFIFFPQAALLLRDIAYGY